MLDDALAAYERDTAVDTACGSTAYHQLADALNRVQYRHSELNTQGIDTANTDDEESAQMLRDVLGKAGGRVDLIALRRTAETAARTLADALSAQLLRAEKMSTPDTASCNQRARVSEKTYTNGVAAWEAMKHGEKPGMHPSAPTLIAAAKAAGCDATPARNDCLSDWLTWANGDSLGAMHGNVNMIRRAAARGAWIRDMNTGKPNASDAVHDASKMFSKKKLTEEVDGLAVSDMGDWISDTDAIHEHLIGWIENESRDRAFGTQRNGGTSTLTAVLFDTCKNWQEVRNSVLVSKEVAEQRRVYKLEGLADLEKTIAGGERDVPTLSAAARDMGMPHVTAENLGQWLERIPATIQNVRSALTRENVRLLHSAMDPTAQRWAGRITRTHRKAWQGMEKGVANTDELREMLLSAAMKKGKDAHGGFTVDHVARAGDPALRVALTFTRLRTHGCEPVCIKEAMMVPSYKNPQKIRPVTVMGTLYKINAHTQYRYERQLMPDLLEADQHGSMAGKSLHDPNLLFQLFADRATHGNETHMDLVDTSSAFDSCSWHMLAAAMRAMGYPETVITSKTQSLHGHTRKICTRGGMSAGTANLHAGSAQGGSESGINFAIIQNVVSRMLLVAEEEGRIKGYVVKAGPANKEAECRAKVYVDDMTLPASGNTAAAGTMAVVSLGYLFTGIQVNAAKSNHISAAPQGQRAPEKVWGVDQHGHVGFAEMSWVEGWQKVLGVELSAGRSRAAARAKIRDIITAFKRCNTRHKPSIGMLAAAVEGILWPMLMIRMKAVVPPLWWTWKYVDAPVATMAAQSLCCDLGADGGESMLLPVWMGGTGVPSISALHAAEIAATVAQMGRDEDDVLTQTFLANIHDTQVGGNAEYDMSTAWTMLATLHSNGVDMHQADRGTDGGATEDQGLADNVELRVQHPELSFRALNTNEALRDPHNGIRWVHNAEGAGEPTTEEITCHICEGSKKHSSMTSTAKCMCCTVKYALPNRHSDGSTRPDKRKTGKVAVIDASNINVVYDSTDQMHRMVRGIGINHPATLMAATSQEVVVQIPAEAANMPTHNDPVSSARDNGSAVLSVIDLGRHGPAISEKGQPTVLVHSAVVDYKRHRDAALESLGVARPRVMTVSTDGSHSYCVDEVGLSPSEIADKMFPRGGDDAPRDDSDVPTQCGRGLTTLDVTNVASQRYMVWMYSAVASYVQKARHSNNDGICVVVRYATPRALGHDKAAELTAQVGKAVQKVVQQVLKNDQEADVTTIADNTTKGALDVHTHVACVNPAAVRAKVACAVAHMVEEGHEAFVYRGEQSAVENTDPLKPGPLQRCEDYTPPVRIYKPGWYLYEVWPDPKRTRTTTGMLVGWVKNSSSGRHVMYSARRTQRTPLQYTVVQQMAAGYPTRLDMSAGVDKTGKTMPMPWAIAMPPDKSRSNTADHSVRAGGEALQAVPDGVYDVRGMTTRAYTSMASIRAHMTAPAWVEWATENGFTHAGNADVRDMIMQQVERHMDDSLPKMPTTIHHVTVQAAVEWLAKPRPVFETCPCLHTATNGSKDCRRNGMTLPFTDEQYTAASKERVIDTAATACNRPTPTPYCMVCRVRFNTRAAFNAHRAGKPDLEGHVEPPEAHGHMSGAGVAYDEHDRAVAVALRIYIRMMSMTPGNSTTAEMLTHAECLRHVHEQMQAGHQLNGVADNMAVKHTYDDALQPTSARKTNRASAPAATAYIRETRRTLENEGTTVTATHVYSHRHPAVKKTSHIITNEATDGVANEVTENMAAAPHVYFNYGVPNMSQAAGYYVSAGMPVLANVRGQIRDDALSSMARRAARHSKHHANFLDGVYDATATARAVKQMPWVLQHASAEAASGTTNSVLRKVASVVGSVTDETLSKYAGALQASGAHCLACAVTGKPHESVMDCQACGQQIACWLLDANEILLRVGPAMWCTPDRRVDQCHGRAAAAAAHLTNYMHTLQGRYDEDTDTVLCGQQGTRHRIPVDAIATVLCNNPTDTQGSSERLDMLDYAGYMIAESIKEPAWPAVRSMHPAVNAWLQRTYDLQEEVAAPLTATSGVFPHTARPWEHMRDGQVYTDSTLVCSSAWTQDDNGGMAAPHPKKEADELETLCARAKQAAAGGMCIVHAYEVGSMTDAALRTVCNQNGGTTVAAFPPGSILWLHHDGAREPEYKKPKLGGKHPRRLRWRYDKGSSALVYPTCRDVNSRVRHACMSNKGKVVWMVFGATDARSAHDLRDLAHVLATTGPMYRGMAQNAPTWCGGGQKRSLAARDQTWNTTAEATVAVRYVTAPAVLGMEWADLQPNGNAVDAGIIAASRAMWEQCQAQGNDLVTSTPPGYVLQLLKSFLEEGLKCKGASLNHALDRLETAKAVCHIRCRRNIEDITLDNMRKVGAVATARGKPSQIKKNARECVQCGLVWGRLFKVGKGYLGTAYKRENTAHGAMAEDVLIAYAERQAKKGRTVDITDLYSPADDEGIPVCILCARVRMAVVMAGVPPLRRQSSNEGATARHATSKAQQDALLAHHRETVAGEPPALELWPMDTYPAWVITRHAHDDDDMESMRATVLATWKYSANGSGKRGRKREERTPMRVEGAAGPGAPGRGALVRQSLTFGHVGTGGQRQNDGAASEASPWPQPQRNRMAAEHNTRQGAAQAKRVRFGDPAKGHVDMAVQITSTSSALSSAAVSGVNVTPHAVARAHPGHCAGRQGANDAQADDAGGRPVPRGIMRAESATDMAKRAKGVHAGSQGKRIQSTVSPSSKRLRGGNGAVRPDHGDAALATLDTWHRDMMCEARSYRHKPTQPGVDDTAVAAKERKHAALQGLQRYTVAYVDAVISNASGVRQLRLDQSDGQARRVYKMGKVLMGRNAILKQHALARTHAQSIIGMVPPTAQVEAPALSVWEECCMLPEHDMMSEATSTPLPTDQGEATMCAAVNELRAKIQQAVHQRPHGLSGHVLSRADTHVEKAYKKIAERAAQAHTSIVRRRAQAAKREKKDGETVCDKPWCVTSTATTAPTTTRATTAGGRRM